MARHPPLLHTRPSCQAREALAKIAMVPPLTAAEEKAIYNMTAGDIAEGVASGEVRGSASHA
jgi:hypothetical protein